MLRRGLLEILPLVFAAVAFLDGTPAGEFGVARASAAVSHVQAVTASVTTGSVTTDLPDIAVSQAADDDDQHDTPVVRTVVSIVWPDSSFADRASFANVCAVPSHRPCAAEPRAPPTA